MKAVAKLGLTDAADAAFDQMLANVQKCSTPKEVKEKYPTEPESTAATLLFEFAVDPKSNFTGVRNLCTSAQFKEVAKVHMQSPFPNASSAAAFIKQKYGRTGLDTRRRLPNGGSVGKLLVLNQFDEALKFVDSLECNTLDDISNHCKHDEDRQVAMRIFNVLKSQDPKHEFYTEFRNHPDRNIRIIVARLNVDAEQEFTSAEEIRPKLMTAQFLVKSSPIGRGSIYLGFSPKGTTSLGGENFFKEMSTALRETVDADKDTLGDPRDIQRPGSPSITPPN